MYISNTQYRIDRLDKSRVATAAQIFTEQFMSENTVWKTIKPTISEVYQFMYDKTLCNTNIAFVLKCEIKSFMMVLYLILPFKFILGTTITILFCL